MSGRRMLLTLAGAIGLVSMATLFVSGRIELPSPFESPTEPWYLDARNARVEAAADGASSRDEFLEDLGQAISSAMPQANALWTSYANRYGTDEAAELWMSERSVELLSYGAYAIPDDPAWSEDPFDDLAWQTHYQSLSWLQAPAGAYEMTGDEEYRDDVREYLLDWIANTPRRGGPSERSWYDGSVGYRVDVVVQLWKVLADALTGSEIDTVLRSLHYHGELLDQYLDEERFVGHNHALFHALSLHNLASAFPELRDASRWRADARARISSLLPEMVDTAEGVSIEEAANYHFVALRLFANAHQYLSRHDDGLRPEEQAVLRRMLTFGAVMLTPTGELPAIGDTSYGSSGARAHLQRLHDGGLGTEVTEFVLSEGSEGERPPDAVFHQRAGYLIVRPEYTVGPGWKDDLQLVVDTSPKSKPHGHHDVMNVLLTAHGSSLLVDSGGPYAHGNRIRQSFVGSRAHNTIEVDGTDHVLGRPVDVAHRDDDAHAQIAGTFTIGPEVENRRIVILLKPDVVVVIDQFRSSDGGTHSYRLLYHLPPEASVGNAGPGGIVDAASAAMGFEVAASDDSSFDVLEGREDPAIGWVTPGHAERRAAPVLSVQQQAADGWFVAAFSPAAAGAAIRPIISVDETADRFDVTVTVAEREWHLILDSEGNVDVRD